LIREFKARAGGHTLGEAGDAQVGSLESLGEVEAGGVPFDIHAESDDDFGDGWVGGACDEFSDAQVLGFDPVDRGEFPSEHVVPATEGRGFFDREDIDGPFDNANLGGIAFGVFADVAGGAIGEGTADGALAHLIACGAEGVGEVMDLVGRGLDDKQRETFGGARADTGQFTQSQDETRDGLG